MSNANKPPKRTAEVITEKTGLPIGMVWVLLVAALGFGGWMAKVDHVAAENTKKIEKLETIEANIGVIKEDIAFIKGRLSDGPIFNSSDSGRRTSNKRSRAAKGGG